VCPHVKESSGAPENSKHCTGAQHNSRLCCKLDLDFQTIRLNMSVHTAFANLVAILWTDAEVSLNNCCWQFPILVCPEASTGPKANLAAVSAFVLEFEFRILEPRIISRFETKLKLLKRFSRNVKKKKQGKILLHHRRSITAFTNSVEVGIFDGRRIARRDTARSGS